MGNLKLLSNQEVLNLVKANLDPLSNALKNYMQIPNLYLSLEVDKNSHIKVVSEDLSEHLSGIGSAIFSSINLDFWGSIDILKGKILFIPKIIYSHYGGGSNGRPILCDTVYYNFNKNEWEFSKNLKTCHANYISAL